MNLLADEVLDLYQPYLEESPLVLREPFVPLNLARAIGQEAVKVLHQDRTLLRLNGPIVVVGDIHGHLFDLYLILRRYGLPPEVNYLFLGDIVDRGEFSIQTVCLIMTLKVKYPKNVYIIRGNHEFRGPSKRGGFYSECEVIYPKTDIYEVYMRAFDQLPLAATINNRIFCIHGGLVPGFTSVEQLEQIQKLSCDDPEGFIAGLLWGDPAEDIDEFGPSKRGIGYSFGKKAVEKFLASSGMKMIVRGHECVGTGIRFSFDGKLITIFSASQYCGCMTNVAAAALIDADDGITSTEFSVPREIEMKRVIVPEKIVVQKRYKHCRGSRPIITPHCSVEAQPPLVGYKALLRRGRAAKTVSQFEAKLPKLAPIMENDGASVLDHRASTMSDE